MNKNSCPGCGAAWNGRRCRSCGYVPFQEGPRQKDFPSKRDKKARKQHPLLGFLMLLALIQIMLPMLRNWGQKLEVIEEINRSVTQEAVIPDTKLLSLYQREDLQIFTTEYDAAHLSDGLTLYIRNNSHRDLVLQTDNLLINGNPAGQQLYCKATANTVSKNWFRFETESESSEIRSVSFRLQAFDMAGNPHFTSDLIALGEGSQTEEPYF